MIPFSPLFLNLVIYKAFWSSLCNFFQPISSFHFVTIIVLYLSKSCSFPTGLSHYQSLEFQTILNYYCRVKFSNVLMICCSHYTMNNPQWFPSAVLVGCKLSLVCMATTKPLHTYLDLEHSHSQVLCSGHLSLLPLPLLTPIPPLFFSFFPWMIISWSRACPSSNNHVTSIFIMCLLFNIESYLCQCFISLFELNCIFLISNVFLGHCSLIYPVTCISLIIRKHF